jgi:hypothetical protein
MNAKTNPHLTLTLSPPIGWERRGNSLRARIVFGKSTVDDRVSEGKAISVAPN